MCVVVPADTKLCIQPDFAGATKEAKLFVANLSFKTTDSQLFELFSSVGKVKEAHHVNDKMDPSRKRGFAFVSFEDPASCEAAVSVQLLSPTRCLLILKTDRLLRLLGTLGVTHACAETPTTAVGGRAERQGARRAPDPRGPCR